MKKNISRNPLWPDWYNGKKIDEVQFGRAFLEQWPLKCVNGTLYTVEEIAQMLSISLRSAYNLCNSTTEFRVLRVGGSIRVPKDSFDAWLYRAA